MPSEYLKGLAAALDPKDEASYNIWSAVNKVPQSDDYDMRGFYAGLLRGDPAALSSVNPNDGQMHFPDKWKLPNHETFSTDSQYYNPATMPNTPTWQGGDLLGGNGAASWALRSPDGNIVAAEAPWYASGIKGKQ